MSQEVRVELLVGRLVRDRSGAPVGRIEELRARWLGEECVVEELHLGPHALVERLAAWPLVRWVWRLFGGRTRRPLRVRWELVDFADPENPRLRTDQPGRVPHRR
jgi:hypothetical protein